MFSSSGFIGKMLFFVLIVTLPVAIIAFWLVSQQLIAFEYAILLTLTPVGPAILIYNRLLKEVSSLITRMEKATDAPLLRRNDESEPRSGLLPFDDILLTMQQHRRVLQSLLRDANLQQQDAIMLFNMLPNPVLVLDSKRSISRFNHAAEVFFNTKNIQGDITTYLRHPTLIKAIEAALKGNSKQTRVEFAIPGSVSRHIAAYIVNLEGEGDEDLRLIMTVHDLTVAKKTEQMRVDFVANASHELRTPLAILIGAIETLQGPAADDLKAHKRFLSMMQTQAGRMSQLIDDLLSLSQIEMYEHNRPSEQVDLKEVLGSVVHMLEGKAKRLDKNLVLNVPEMPVSVLGEKGQLYQVFINLVDNALKYGREDTSVTVSLLQDGKDVRVGVADQGEGIPEEHLPRLTERFYRVDSDRSRQMGGTGLGLAIVKHIVSRHRGSLDVDSEMGVGSVFTIKLPQNISLRP
jgi:two-component system, OmpR family, phosphate regulon sensor histidine kinase PhoR